MRPLTDHRAKAEHALAQAMEQLDDDLQRRLIDEPIDRAAAGIASSRQNWVTHETLHRVVAELVQHLCRQGFGICRCSSLAQAQDEGVFLLRHIYQGVSGSGYDAAMADGRLQEDGLRLVIHHLVESIKAWRRQLHLLWIKSRIVGLLDWEVRCEMAQILLDRLEPYMPAGAKSLDPAWFAEDPLALLDMMSSTSPAALLSQAGLQQR